MLVDAYCRPVARLAEGQRLAPRVSAMMDVSDGLLLDAQRMASASGVRINIDLALLPLSDDYRRMRGDSVDSRMQAASWGDDYQLLFAAPETTKLPVAATAIGTVAAGADIALFDGDAAIALPPSLGYQHH
jgi:thiamine-monophosphate kinase